MYRKLMLFLVLLSSAAWLQAQAGYPQSSPTQSAPTSENQGAMSTQTTVQGCLQGSAGSYTLQADNGTTYQLTGDTSKLSAHVGHEVQITGTTSGSSAMNNPNSTTPNSTQSATTPSSTSQATLDVQSMKHIAKTCRSSGTTTKY